MIGTSWFLFRVFLVLLAISVPLAAIAADRVVVLEHYTNFR